ncbi:Uncharacterised protein [Mycobacteroides abscessus subsp. bolletii]|uniref:hypothetical protein n=1 Tax=Mycobacteroides abscessus TaxID=36809 RepID=UPI0003012CF5|nr:hypothetical protein [Mycobacteroides abscessus]SHQ64376.1 Uncharacterised protein [Mycobacteroides abscessus subsp. bolletii]SHS47896.1 Uncharacterised protein [Mycobacteroides abscessus subsp. bolletii]SHT06995.1 Uncharacterised protein [Mycobacteroides abscessus subsp. bolletii]SHT15035.1 Uncharacterised protein [Mycobacteroides abscessus subsp. bolletii]SHY50378.1 Uncharacterised protein [Mycobacteroides abscessus subsp. bolletii]
MPKQYIWWELLEQYGSAEAAWTWLRQNIQREDTLVGGDQQLLDILWREGLVKPIYSDPITMDTSSIIQLTDP